jgi:ABC-type amino acid transport substrate-binding protein
MRIRSWGLACCVAVGLVAAAPVDAQVDEPPAQALAGALKRIRNTGVVRIGYRESAVPFSFAKAGVEPYGYSIDLCREIAEDLAAAVGGRALRIEFRRVTPQDRLDQVASGRIDLECGSTTITTERRHRVAFSPVIFVAGTRLLVKRGSALHSMRDLAGRTVVAVTGTTNARAMTVLGAGRVRGLRVTNAGSYDQALAMVDIGSADALAADDILIMGLIAERGLGDRYLMVGDPLSPEPYGIAFAAGDAALADVVRTTFARLAASRELRRIYAKWFLRPLPSGARIGLPMSTELERSFEVLGLPPE